MGARAEKTRFFGQIFPKSAQKRLFGLFFQNFAFGSKRLNKKDLFGALGELGKSN